MTKSGVLLALGGLPGTGKTTISRLLAKRTDAVYLRIDTIEQALKNAGVSDDGPGGYFAAYKIAEDNLKLGRTVVADSVNSLAIIRDAWLAVAQQAGACILEIEVVCSDPVEHKRRVETRKADIAGHKIPTWQEVLGLTYETWARPHLVVDSAVKTSQDIVDTIVNCLGGLESPAICMG